MTQTPQNMQRVMNNNPSTRNLNDPNQILEVNLHVSISKHLSPTNNFQKVNEKRNTIQKSQPQPQNLGVKPIGLRDSQNVTNLRLQGLTQGQKPHSTESQQYHSSQTISQGKQHLQSSSQKSKQDQKSNQRNAKSRDSNVSRTEHTVSTSLGQTFQNSHFTLNNIQSIQKSPFYSPKNLPGSLQHGLLSSGKQQQRPGTALESSQNSSQLSRFQGPSKISGTKKQNGNGLIGLNKSQHKINETIQEHSSRNLNASQSRAKLVTSESKTVNQFGSVGNLQESTMVTFSPQSTNLNKLTPGSNTNCNNTIQKRNVNNQIQTSNQSNITQKTQSATSKQGVQAFNNKIEHPLHNPHQKLNQNQNIPQESFKSTFVNFRASMKEDVHARAPKVNNIKKSPRISPRKLLNATLSRMQTINQNISHPNMTVSSRLDVLESERATYQNYINDYQNSIEEESEFDESKRNSASPLRQRQQIQMIQKESIDKQSTFSKQLQQSTSKSRFTNNYEESKQFPKSQSKGNKDFLGTMSNATTTVSKITNRNTAATSRDTIMTSPKGILGNKLSPRANRSQTIEEQFWAAAENGNLAQLSHLVLMGVDVNCQNHSDDGWAAIHYASHEGFDQVVEHLIRKLGANVNQLTNNGRTALHISCTQQHRAVIERLLLAGANANIKTKSDGNTPLHILSRFCGNNQSQELIKLILPFSQESLSMKNKNGFTPAELTPYPNVKEMLRKKQLESQNMSRENNYEFEQDLEPTVKNSGVKGIQQIGTVNKKQQYKNITVKDIDHQDVKAMFDQLNVQMKNYRPCFQPRGEHDSDDLLFESTSSMNMISQDNSLRGGQAPMKHQNIYTTHQTDEYNVFNPSQDQSLSKQQYTSYDRQENQSQLLSPKNPGPKIAQLKGGQGLSNATIFNPASVLKQQQLLHEFDNIQSPQTSHNLQKNQSRRNLRQNPSQKSTQANAQIDQHENDKQRIGPDNFVAHQLLGTGSFGEVYLVEKISSKKLYAMKVLSKSKIKQQNLIKYALTERNVMSVMHHPFIVRLRYAFQTQDKLFLICDYCPGGDLSQYLEIERQFSEEKAKFYIVEILLALESLHERDIIFRDLKPDNVVLDEQGHALLTDFGLSKEGVMYQNGGAKSFCGSYAYLAPEMIRKAGHGKAVDWYLLGVVFYEMLTGMPPYYADDKEVLFQNIMNNTLEIPEHVSPQCQDLLIKLLNKNPLKRLGSKHGAPELKSHSYFSDVDWQSVYERKLQPPEPYLAEYAKSIIQVSPYMAAGHPQTRGKQCQRDHPGYVQGWSFAESSSKRNSTQERNTWYVGSVVGQQVKNKDSQLQGGLWISPPQVSIPNSSEITPNKQDEQSNTYNHQQTIQSHYYQQ
eukprot:403357105